MALFYAERPWLQRQVQVQAEAGLSSGNLDWPEDFFEETVQTLGTEKLITGGRCLIRLPNCPRALKRLPPSHFFTAFKECGRVSDQQLALESIQRLPEDTSLSAIAGGNFGSRPPGLGRPASPAPRPSGASLACR